MMSVNKSATLIGTLVFKTGALNTLHIGSNSNTGETIVWQQVQGKPRSSRITGWRITGKPRSSRITGRRITGLADELALTLEAGNASWLEPPAVDALEALWQHRSPRLCLKQEESAMSERQSPGFARMKKNLGPDAAERLRLDTVRLQEEALRSIREPVKPRKKAGPEHLNKIIEGK